MKQLQMETDSASKCSPLAGDKIFGVKLYGCKNVLDLGLGCTYAD